MGDEQRVFPGADERTPSRSQYFSWINNTNEGATEAQTLANLAFFRYLHEAFGMTLDIYAFDAGAIDGAKFYGSVDSERFHRQFPRGFAPMVAEAKAINTRLGVWGGPDGFGDTPEEEQARIDMMVSLCRDYDFALFKFDGVCGGLRPEKQDAFVRMMTGCRQYSPDLILLNHRLKLGTGMPHATTWLWGGQETYIDTLIANETPAPHNRACTLTRGLPPELQRLTEDHGVCLSSCLDYWEDELVLQAFNRNLILAPEIYGSPWLLRDDELPRLARIYNLHQHYRDIMVDGQLLPEEQYGPHAVARGDGNTRVITLRNLNWEPVSYTVTLDASIGLTSGDTVSLQRLHPHERLLGEYAYGDVVAVEVLPFRACLLVASTAVAEGVQITGCDYDVISELPGQPVFVDLLGMPGTTATVHLDATQATLDGHTVATVDGDITVEFPGEQLQQEYHRKLGELLPIALPDDAESLYEATCFAADSNALEVRELQRSGASDIPEVRAARAAFFEQRLFRGRYLWDRYLFDDDPETAFGVCRRWIKDLRVRSGAFRLDFGEVINIDQLTLTVGGDYFLQPLKSEEAIWGAVSADLRSWTPIQFFITEDIAGQLPADLPIRYLRLNGCPDLIREVRGSYRGRALVRSKWRASNLLAPYNWASAVQAWSLPVTLTEAPAGAYLAVAIHGECGNELAYAAVRMGESYVGAPRRSPSFPSNTWECPVRQVNGNYTYYIPVTPEMVGRELEIIVLLLNGGNPDIRLEAWITAYPIPWVKRRLSL